MAVTGKRGVGIPTILLHDGEGTIVTIELKSGETYRGYLEISEDNMNCLLRDAVRTDPQGKQTHVEHVYLRGSQIVFIILPDIYPFLSHETDCLHCFVPLTIDYVAECSHVQTGDFMEKASWRHSVLGPRWTRRHWPCSWTGRSNHEKR